MTLGAKIRRFRDKSGLSQDNVAFRLGISQPTYCKIESDAKTPNFGEMLKISEILETNLKEFMPDGHNHLNIENNNGQANNGSLVQQASSKKGILDTCVQMLKEQLSAMQHENLNLRTELKAETEELEKMKIISRQK